MKNHLLKFWPIGFILMAWFIFSLPFFSKGLVPFPSNYLVSFFPPWQYSFKVPPYNTAMPDVLAQLYPWRHLVIESFKNGQFPLWNPYLFSGTPLLANFQSAAFSPLNALFFILPFDQAWSLLIILQPLLGMIFMLLFLRELKISQWGALAGAISFGFSGFIVVWMAYGTLSLTVAWLPLLLWAVEKNFKKTTFLYLSLIAVISSFAIFSGHFQTSLYVLLTAAAYSLFKFWQTKNSMRFFLTFVFLFLGILLAAPQIFPSIELYFHSVRGVSFKQTEVIPWSYLTTLLAPDFFGNPTTQNNWFGHYAEWAGFIGVWPLILGIWAFLCRRQTKEIYFFFILGIVSLLFALQSPLADLLVNLKIPVLSTSASSRVIVIFSFSFSILAAFGLDILSEEWKRKEQLKKFTLYLLSILLVFAFLWLVTFLRILPDDKLIIAKRNLILPSLIFAAGSIVLLAGFFLRKNLRIVLLLAILLILSFDCLRFAKKWMPFEARENLYPDLAITKFLQQEIGSNRVFGNFGNELAVYFHIPSIEGYDPLYPRRYKELIGAGDNGKIGDLFADRSTVKLEKNGNYSPRLLQLLGVKYILYAKDDGRSPWVFPFWKNLEDYDLISDGPKYQVLESKKVLPRAFLVGGYEVLREKQAIIDRILADDFDLREKVVLEEDLGEKISQGDGRVEIKNYTPNEVKIEVEQDKPQLLLLSDNYYPGWKAFMDGKETKIYRANYTFRAVTVPAGKHQIEFIYDSPTFRWGIYAFLLAILSIITIGVSLKKIAKDKK
ncbi:MAG: YfhO family protein [bacterium]|nr:YfhO family protein [bacterium]